MDEPRECVIVGANLAGARAAETLRAEGYAGKLVLLGEDPRRPYGRPPLSKQFLKREQTEEKLYLHPADFYARKDITLRLGVRAVALDAAARTVTTDTGEAIAFDRLLIATGCSPRALGVPGESLPNVVMFRTLDDALRLQEHLAPGRRLVIVGGGFIGAELAAACRQLGLEVTVVERASSLMEAALGAELGAAMTGFHRAQGVVVRTGEGVARIEGDAKAEQVVTSAGAVLPCDVVAVGVGVVPATGWITDPAVARTAKGAVVVDRFAQSSVPGIYAAGDVAAFEHPAYGQHLHLEHYTHAQQHAVLAAKNMLGRGIVYDALPSFWSDQFDLRMQSVGFARSWDRVVVRGELASRAFVAFYMREGRVLSALVVNRVKDLAALRPLVLAQAVVDPAALADPDRDLKSLYAPA